MLLKDSYKRLFLHEYTEIQELAGCSKKANPEVSAPNTITNTPKRIKSPSNTINNIPNTSKYTTKTHQGHINTISRPCKTTPTRNLPRTNSAPLNPQQTQNGQHKPPHFMSLCQSSVWVKPLFISKQNTKTRLVCKHKVTVFGALASFVQRFLNKKSTDKEAYFGRSWQHLHNAVVCLAEYRRNLSPRFQAFCAESFGSFGLQLTNGHKNIRTFSRS